MSARYRAKPRHCVAYCWQSGVIGFTTTSSPFCPDGSLPIIAGPWAKVRRAIYATARIAYNNRDFLVPGVPEAKLTKHDPVAALCKYRDWLLKRPALYKAIPIAPKERRAA